MLLPAAEQHKTYLVGFCCVKSQIHGTGGKNFMFNVSLGVTRLMSSK